MADYDAFESAAPSQVEKLLLAPSDMDSAVVSRSTVKFRPQGTSTYGSGSRTMQFRLSSSDYASLDTLTFGFKLTRKYGNCVQEDLFALSCIQDLRVEVAGVVCEDLRGVNPRLLGRAPEGGGKLNIKDQNFKVNIKESAARMWRPCTCLDL